MMGTAAALSLSISTHLKPCIQRRFKPSKRGHNSASRSEQHPRFLVYSRNHDPFLSRTTPPADTACVFDFQSPSVLSFIKLFARAPKQSSNGKSLWFKKKKKKRKAFGLFLIIKIYIIEIHVAAHYSENVKT
ncbi:hypothetical protein CXB51_009590 [Gossypium anomalum]|uniref:Uncharacterized protein n=1 Tax=Gossypium anomalum TaxID=47600 RepID=A0A8J5ZML5_9ROSI|nr:hypothetical protein CXB51_009590 [Gossypium anomalum]